MLVRTALLLALVLHSTSLYSASPATASALERVARLRALLAQQPWDKPRLQRMFALSLQHKRLLEDAKQGHELAVQQIEADPDYVPDLLDVSLDIIHTLHLEQQQVEKLLLWEVSDPQGGKHWLFGTVHTLAFANFTATARAQLEKIIDDASVIMHEHLPIEIAYALLKDQGYESAIDKLASLDLQIVARGIHGGKKIVALENIGDRIEIQLAHSKILHRIRQLLADLAASIKAGYTNRSVEHEALSYMETFENFFALHSAYFTADLHEISEKIQSLGDWAAEEVVVRNRIWIDRIVSQCQQSDGCLIVAGHGHMTLNNADNLITQLRERGFTVNFVE